MKKAEDLQKKLEYLNKIKEVPFKFNNENCKNNNNNFRIYRNEWIRKIGKEEKMRKRNRKIFKGLKRR